MEPRQERQRRLRACRIYLVVTPAAHGPPWREALEAALATGLVGAVQLREKALDDGALLERAGGLRALCDRHDALFLLNDRGHLVRAAAADGVHVGQEDLPVEAARRMVGSERLVGLSTHDAAELGRAAGLGADYAGLGPCFATATKTLTRSPGGAALVRRGLAAAGALPVFPIGGIDAGNVGELVAAGARRVAVGAGILEAADPAAATRAIHDRLADGGVGPSRRPPDRASI